MALSQACLVGAEIEGSSGILPNVTMSVDTANRTIIGIDT